MSRLPPRSTRTDTLFPYTTLFRSQGELFVVDAVRRHPVQHVAQWTQQHAALERGAIHGRAAAIGDLHGVPVFRSEEHTSELPSLMRISYAVFCLKKKKEKITDNTRLSQTHKSICK